MLNCIAFFYKPDFFLSPLHEIILLHKKYTANLLSSLKVSKYSHIGHLSFTNAILKGWRIMNKKTIAKQNTMCNQLNVNSDCQVCAREVYRSFAGYPAAGYSALWPRALPGIRSNHYSFHL